MSILIGEHILTCRLGVRVEWMKARARYHRWQEERNVLPEECRRTIEFHSWKAGWWSGLATQRENADIYLQEGLRAYAAEQASLRRELARHADALWKRTVASIQHLSGGDVASGDLDSHTNLNDSLIDVDPDELFATNDDDNNNNGDNDDEGVQELEESEAVIASLEIDVEY